MAAVLSFFAGVAVVCGVEVPVPATDVLDSVSVAPVVPVLVAVVLAVVPVSDTVAVVGLEDGEAGVEVAEVARVVGSDEDVNSVCNECLLNGYQFRTTLTIASRTACFRITYLTVLAEDFDSALALLVLVGTG